MTKLGELGLDRWMADKARELCGSELSLARITAVDRGRYLIRGEEGEVPAELTGKFLHLAESSDELPCVGDWVCVRYRDGGTQASIHQLVPRRSVLRRKAAGREFEFQVIAANIDVAFIVQACQFDFNVARLERYLVMVRSGRIEPVILLTKTDLVASEELEQLVRQVRSVGGDANIICVSNTTGEGVDRVHQLIACSKTYCMLGSSGVGKTTLINRLLGADALQTGEVSHTGEGRHTTTRRQLFVFEHGGLLIDLPGMRELGMLGNADGINDSFSHVRALALDCRYADCRHEREPGCAVRAAVERRELSKEQFRSYLKLRSESEFNDLSYVDQRKKDRAFGRFLHSYKKQKGRTGRN